MLLKNPPFATLLLLPFLACAKVTPRPGPQAEAIPQAPDAKALRGTISAELIRKVAAFKCDMSERQASISQSILHYLSSRDEEPYTATQSRIGQLTILTIHARGMTRERATDLADGAPRDRVRQFGWDMVILANDREGWVFDMAPEPAARPDHKQP